VIGCNALLFSAELEIHSSIYIVLQLLLWRDPFRQLSIFLRERPTKRTRNQRQLWVWRFTSWSSELWRRVVM